MNSMTFFGNFNIYYLISIFYVKAKDIKTLNLKNKKQRTDGGIVLKKIKAPKITFYSANVQPPELLNEVTFLKLISLMGI